MPSRTAHPLTDVAVRLVADRDDSRVVNVFVDDGDVAWGLHDEHVVVVRPRSHRRTRVRPHQTPITKTAVGVVVGESVTQIQPPNTIGAVEVFGVGYATVWWVDYE